MPWYLYVIDVIYTFWNRKAIAEEKLLKSINSTCANREQKFIKLMKLPGKFVPVVRSYGDKERTLDLVYINKSGLVKHIDACIEHELKDDLTFEQKCAIRFDEDDFD